MGAQPKKARHSHHQTQWAAQFAVASELCKRGYQVSLTLGNHPAVDLMVLSPSNRQFKVDVKGLHEHNFWIIRRRPLDKDLIYVLVYVPDPPEPNSFYVLSHEEVLAALPGETYKVEGIQWGASQAFKDRWNEVLPS